jgi:hypothetical protein
LFAEVDYCSEEWVGVQDSAARLGIFGNKNKPELKMVFCLELSRNILKCDAAASFRKGCAPYLALDDAKYTGAANLTDSSRACHCTLTIKN